MRILLAAALLVATAASAQTSAPTLTPTDSKSDWTRVQVLKMGTNVHIKTLDHGNIRCAIGETSDVSITCGGVVFQRSKILYIKNSHRVRSTLVGFAAGYGTAIGITLAETEHCRDLNCSVGLAAAVVFIDLGLFIATPIVFGVYDLTAGTIYKAPTT
jgi:hypothetical protein